MYSPFLLLHICGATVGLISGALSMLVRKGSGLHRAAGVVFAVAMFCMTSGAIVLAIEKWQPTNLVMGVFTSYLVATGWMSAKRRDARIRRFDRIALLVIAGVAAALLTLGVLALRGTRYPAGMYFTFGSIALLFAASDVRMLVRGG